jgi:hypothetical protein
LKKTAEVTYLPGDVGAWLVTVDGERYLALTPEEAMDAIFLHADSKSISISWENVPQNFEPPGWEGRRPRRPPEVIA